MKTASFTVHASAEQSRRWKMAAESEGHRSAGSWLACAADAYLKARARAGLPIPLAWNRRRFSVRLGDGETVTVKGHTSPPFGSFAGTEDGPADYCGRKRHVLVHLPDSKIIAVLRSFRQCMALASELAPAYARDDAVAAAITERHRREST